ncbi:hypothetical protein Q5O24_13715 [Eubacteriaceae bacterium ES3]|nr:hypothetical protein Q5O24_13715 [Eubacteriaceae bacterium ES3]
MTFRQILQGILTLLVVTVAIVILLLVDNTAFGQYDSGLAMEMTQEQALAAMEDASVLLFRGDKERTNHRPEIYANGQLAGRFVETGFLDVKYAVEVDDSEIFHWEYWYEDVGEGIAATSYICYNGDGTVLGYAEETVIEFIDGSIEYEYLFYDADKNAKDYFMDETSLTIYSMDGKRLVETDTAVESENYDIHINTLENAQVDLQDKVLMLVQQFDAWNG